MRVDAEHCWEDGEVSLGRMLRIEGRIGQVAALVDQVE